MDKLKAKLHSLRVGIAAVVRKNAIRQRNQMNSRDTIAKCSAFSDSFRS